SPVVPFYRAWSAGATDHFYTTNLQEYNAATSGGGYAAEGVAAQVFPPSGTAPGVGAVPFYRLYSPSGTDHFYTTNEAEANNAAGNLGYTYEGVSSFIYPTSLCGAVPLYRMYNPKVIDHFYTTNINERQNAIRNLGYSDEGIAGYVNSLRGADCP
ncbi:uncharacterized protein BXZ73DRAFT_52705, partial [Epithele typhae]|uniref:uncharacterized protein n=1 Tax=Epithele typhae TaxID=378194 RepID=UPI002008BA5E